MATARKESDIAKKARSTEIADVVGRDGPHALPMEVSTYVDAVQSTCKATSKILQSEQSISMLICVNGRYIEISTNVQSALQLLDRTNAECLVKALSISLAHTT